MLRLSIFSQRNAGLFGLLGTLLFILVFVFLGFYQPGYNHFRDTISMLVLGEQGFLQTVSFLMLALTFLTVGLGMGWSIYKKILNPISTVLGIFALGLVLATIFSTHDLSSRANIQLLPLTEQIHFWGTLTLILFAPTMLFYLLRGMRKSKFWSRLVPYTIFVLVSNFVLGVTWFYLLNFNFFYPWKGLCQKLLTINVLVWLMIVSWKLRKRVKQTNLY